MTQFPKKVVLLGSGGLRIGQAGEFDYSGSQAIKALKEEGIRTVVINPNIATVQTDEGLADEIYLEPLQVGPVEKILEKERPDAILLSFGGQTALNLGLELEEKGILERLCIRVLGTSVQSIRISEDRDLFKKALDQIGAFTAKSVAVSSLKQALEVAEEFGYPLMMRSGFSLGGLGSGRIGNAQELKQRVQETLSHVPQILIEEYLGGWKEIEYEVLRDIEGNSVTVCNMENFDPMGIHTGESIVVAPSQTLTNEEYHRLRTWAIQIIDHLGIVGECNIQYALNPHNGEFRVIEVNARLSRSSALASKATGYPIAFVAAKLTLGIPLPKLRNQITKVTSAFFEPALDYLVVKMPRWDMQKFQAADRRIGSEMKSVGEVMAIGRTFPEAIQKAVRMLNIGLKGVHDAAEHEDISQPTDRRLYSLYQSIRNGESVEDLHEKTGIDCWFISQLKRIFEVEQALTDGSFPLKKAKQMGFSDEGIAGLIGCTEEEVRKKRHEKGILPVIKQIDTLAGEFAAETNYLYMTYHGTHHDIEPSDTKPIAVIGSGPYCIGSSVEFDWSAVNALKSLRRHGKSTILINSNPETVSTDYDESDRLYFEELSAERIQDIVEFEKVEGVVVSVGGQIANNMTPILGKRGVPILGTPFEQIDRAENRMTFSQLLNDLEIDQPAWEEVQSIEKAKEFARLNGYPVLVRPSYVLSGAAMNVVHDEHELEIYLKQATLISRGYPVVLSQFIQNAKELEIDGVAKDGKIIIQVICEHVENAGVHSGDATMVLPPQRLYLETIRRTKQVTRQVVKALQITGPFNLQFIAKDNAIKVIECNVRAARSFPFVSKVTGHNLIEIMVQAFLGEVKESSFETLELDYVGVKTPQFSYNRLKGANPVAQVEMASTGEVACIGKDLHDAFFRSWLASGQRINGKRLLVSIGGDQKKKFFPALRELDQKGWKLFATEGTHEYLVRNGVAAQFVYKASDQEDPNVTDAIANHKVDLILNIPNRSKTKSTTDGFRIRRLAIDHNIPLITNPQIAHLFLQCLTKTSLELPIQSPILSWNERLQKEKV